MAILAAVTSSSSLAFYPLSVGGLGACEDLLGFDLVIFQTA